MNEQTPERPLLKPRSEEWQDAWSKAVEHSQYGISSDSEEVLDKFVYSLIRRERELEAALKSAIHALEFYKKEENYIVKYQTSNCGMLSGRFSEIHSDRGRNALLALSIIQKTLSRDSLKSE